VPIYAVIPAGVVDVLTGLSAPFVAYWWCTGKPYARSAAILWNHGLEIGVVGYDYRQITGDPGPGALLGPFIGTVDAVGPGLSYSTKIGEIPVTINFS
jgi:Putative MetA-pathway of phenol degradation